MYLGMEVKWDTVEKRPSGEVPVVGLVPIASQELEQCLTHSRCSVCRVTKGRPPFYQSGQLRQRLKT